MGLSLATRIFLWPITFVIVFLIVSGLGVGITYLLCRRLIRGARTVKDITLDEKLRGVKDEVLRWFGQREFKIDEERENFVKAKKGHLDPRIYFELTFKEENDKCSLHGEFYIKSRMLNELDLREKVIWGRWPRREGFKLMNEFIDFLKRGK